MRFAAVRTVSETDDFRLVEGLAFPFRGRDTYRTFFSTRTDFHWELFPDVIPGATRAEAPLFIRPGTYHHGFDPEIGLARIAGWSPVRSDADGVWVQAQIAKRAAYYEGRLKPLLDAGALGLSGGSAEHSVRIDERSGEILDWPAYELAFTPVESNPLAQLASRSGDAAAALRIVGMAPAVRTAEYAGALRVVSTMGPILESDVTEAIAALADPPISDAPAGTDDAAKSGIRTIQTFSDISASIELNEELPEAFDTLTSAIYSAIWATDRDFNPVPPEDKRSAIQTSLDQFRDYVLGLIDQAPAERSGTALVIRSAIRAGRRNSATDTAALTTAHDNLASVLGMDCAPDGDAARSADVEPGIRIVAEPVPTDADQALRDLATRVGEQAAARLLERL